jgi:flagellar basal-body rod modification protein FlgD
MADNTVNSVSSASGLYSSAATTRTPAKVLGQDDFLKLLVAQLTTQDPLNPTKDTDFIAQMAQFSSLEQSKAMQSDMALLRSEQQLLQANGLIGRAVNLQVGTATTPLTGVVSSVQIEAGTPKLVVNGTSYDMSQLLSVAPAPTQP